MVFIDMLGFAALTEQWPLDRKKLIEGSRPLALERFGRLEPENELTKAFSSFHRAVEWGISFERGFRPLTAITFSDSAFVATGDLPDALGLAQEFVRSTLSEGVPVRVGIACGSFTAIRFRSDIMADGGDHAALFLGTAVVRAYQAEKCGIKGIRILLHPSVERLLVGKPASPGSLQLNSGYGILRCAEPECANRAGVHHEMDYWDLAPSKERTAWHAIQDMWERAPTNAREHYEATAKAVNRMRVARGEPSLVDFRRRTLPRRRR